MVTTLAFGMGIDKLDIRFVVHIDLPKSIETYYQQVECAGIDGLASESIIFYNLNDIIQLKKIIHNSTNNTVNKNAEFQKLNEVLAFVESIKCRRNMLLSYLGEEFYHNCNNCDNCKNRPEIFNANIDAKKVISCIYRIKQKKAKVGINYIIMFLRGIEDDKILNFSLHKLPSFGIGKDKNNYYWEAVIRQLIINNFLYYNFREKTLNLTTKSLNLIRGKCDIFLRKDILSDNNEKTKNNILTNKSNTIFLSPEEQDLFEHLKELRKNLALEKKVPSYVIFHNKTLIDMVINKPKNIEELGNISGVGHCKLKIYGKTFIEVINSKQ